MNNTFAFIFQKITISTPNTTLHTISFHVPVLFISKTQLFHHLISIPSSCVLLSLFPSTDAHHPSGCGVLTHPPLTCVVSTPPPLPDRVGCSLTGVCSHTHEGKGVTHSTLRRQCRTHSAVLARQQHCNKTEWKGKNTGAFIL